MYENTVLSKQGIKLTGLGKFGNFTASLSFAVMEGKTGGSSDLPIFHSEKRFRLYGMGGICTSNFAARNGNWKISGSGDS